MMETPINNMELTWCANFNGILINKVKPPNSNTHRKTNTMYHMHTLGASKCMHVVHSVGFAMGVGDGWFYLSVHVVRG